MKEHDLSLAEILAPLSRALDLAEGRADGHAVRSCLIGMRLGEAVGLDAASRTSLYYALLLQDAGASADAAPVARLFGADDRAVKRDFRAASWPRSVPAALYGLRKGGRGRPLIERVVGAARLGMAGPGAGRRIARLRADQGADVVRRLGLPEEAARAIHALEERWDGGGHPDGLGGTDIPRLARVAGVARAVAGFVAAGGVTGALDMVAVRRGRWFEPRLVDEVAGWAEDRPWWRAVLGPDAERAAVDAEPLHAGRQLDEEGVDAVAGAFARVIDAKRPYARDHSRSVARYAVAIAGELGLSGSARRDLHRAGLLHDIGMLGVSSRVLDHPGPLSPRERARVQRHPAHGWRVLKRVPAFRSFSWPAVLHHERLDGSGYPWGVDWSELDVTARILGVADAFDALTAQRPYRGPLAPSAALAVLRRSAGSAFDAEALAALEAVALRGADAARGAA